MELNKQYEQAKTLAEKEAKATGHVNRELLAAAAAAKKESDALKKLSKNGDGLTKSQRRLNTILNKVGSRFPRLAAAASKATEKLKAMKPAAAFLGKSFGAAAKAAGVLTAAGAAVGVGIFTMTKSFAEAGDKVFFASQKFGLSTEAFSKWSFVARQNGADADTLGKAIQTLSKNAVANSTDFTRWGIKLRKSNGALKDTEELFREASGVVAGLESPTLKSAAAMQLFGRSGMSLVPMFNAGAEGMAELGRKSDALGITISATSAAMSNEFNNQLGAAQESLGAVTRQVAESFMPMFIRAFNAVQDGIVAFGESLRPLKPFIVATVGAAFKFAAEVTAVFIRGITKAIQTMQWMAQAGLKVASFFSDKYKPALEEAARAYDVTGKAGETLAQAIENISATADDNSKIILKKVVPAQNAHAQALINTIGKTKELAKLEKERKKEAAKAAKAAEKEAATLLKTSIAEADAAAALTVYDNYYNALEAKSIKFNGKAILNAKDGTDQVLSAFSSLGMAMATVEEGQSRIAEGFKAMGVSMAQSALALAKKVIQGYAYQAAAAAFAGNVGAPGIGLALGAAAGAAALGVVEGYLSSFHGGGIVGRLSGRDNVPIMAQEGEMVLSRDLTKRLLATANQPPSSLPVQRFATGGIVQPRSQAAHAQPVNFTIQTLGLPNRTEAKRWLRDVVAPELADLRRSGLVTL